MNVNHINRRAAVSTAYMKPISTRLFNVIMFVLFEVLVFLSFILMTFWCVSPSLFILKVGTYADEANIKFGPFFWSYKENNETYERVTEQMEFHYSQNYIDI
ncbi:hypothetical protein RF11_06981 [Thelohanellus kitauei]|uniref:Uncharacterized protein n=1 Tax=Thelohanellus kitauei TaxID=669202 RepID=A0A0C2MTK9_THEKT|nr:hypothetical protein RF11_06981 [Thelohanellus kitauei]